ncbi:hypothetical protein BBO_04947 [Beauveria brongniartii RCEF 3172]|uniref:GPI anchored protein n=1 Tax=Beauveria brongniartii RCEF 3172 TaxID=1081107 RepID=A0A167DY00_9HYPO|nr:hypothetical protein BBO_04947 [Beauveria brongniartii RCEF 3172]
MKFTLLSLAAAVSAVAPRERPPQNSNPVQTGGETTPTASLSIIEPIVSFTALPTTSGSDKITIPILTSDSTHTTHPLPSTSESSLTPTALPSSTEGSTSSSSSHHSGSSGVTTHNSTTSSGSVTGSVTGTTGSASGSRTASSLTSSPSAAAAAAATANAMAGIAAIAGLVIAA